MRSTLSSTTELIEPMRNAPEDTIDYDLLIFVIPNELLR